MLTKMEKIIIATAGGLIAWGVFAGGMGAKTYIDYLRAFLEQWEKFSPVPYWDVSRYSWGYGTAAPGPDGSITKDDAWNEALDHIKGDYNYLFPLLTVSLNPRQLAALLSFSYNEGPGNAENLMDNINTGQTDALGAQWNKYIYADHVINSDLIARRAAEWRLWNS